MIKELAGKPIYGFCTVKVLYAKIQEGAFSSPFFIICDLGFTYK